jgi:hypothetical protein
MEQVLLISGRMRPDTLQLDPAFRIQARPALPSGQDGPYRLSGTDASGGTVFEVRFAAAGVVDLPTGPEEQFAFAIPLSDQQWLRLHRLELVAADGRQFVRTAQLSQAQLDGLLGSGQALDVQRTPESQLRLRWDSSRFPMIMVRDASSREILAFGRGGELTLPPGTGALEVVVSEGVHSGATRIELR